MILICSAGHRVDTRHPFEHDRKPGDRCGMELSYDRIHGLTRCRRVLRAEPMFSMPAPDASGKPLIDIL